MCLTRTCVWRSGAGDSHRTCDQ